MGVLTWRDVAAPNFSGVQDGFQNFGNLITNALTAARAGLSKYDQAGIDRSNNALLADIAAAPTVDAAQAIAARVANDPHRGDYSAATLAALQSRPESIIKQAANQSDLNFTNWNRANDIKDRAALDAAGPALAAAAADIQSNDPTKVAAGHEQVTKILSSLSGSQVIPMIDKLQGVESGALGITGTRTEQANSAQDRQLGQLADIAAGVLRQSGFGPTEWNAAFPALQESLIKQYGPVNGALIAERARASVFHDDTAPVGGAGSGAVGGGSGGGGAGYDAVYGNGLYGTPNVNPTQMNLGQVIDFGANTLRPNTKAKGVGVVNGQTLGTSAMGGYQFEASTLQRVAPKVFGDNWQNVQFTPENQDKLGQYLYNEAKANGTDLHNVWTSLPKGTFATGANGSWDNIKSKILAGESGAPNVHNLIAQATQTLAGQTGPAYNKSQDPNQVFAQEAVAALNDTADARTVAAQLTSAGGNGQQPGPLAGEDLATVSGNVKAIADKYHISPAYAGLILRKSAGFNKNGPESAWDSFKGIFGGGDALKSKIDWTQVDQLAKLAGNRDALIKQAQAAQANDASSTLVAAGNQAQQQALAVIQQKIALARATGRAYNPAADLIAAGISGDLYNQAMTNSAGITAAGSRTPAAPPTLNRQNVPQHAQAPAAPTPKPNTPVAAVTALINQHLTAARNVRAKIDELKKSGNDTPFNLLRISGNIRREENAALQLAMTLPRFAQQNNESYTMWRDRVAKAIHLGSD